MRRSILGRGIIRKIFTPPTFRMWVNGLLVCGVLGLRIAVGLSETHSLIGTYTAVNADEFSALWLDGEKVDSYSYCSTGSELCHNWTREGISRAEWMHVKLLNKLQWDRGRTDILKGDEALNLSGAAVLQGIFGCEIERNPDSGLRVTGTFAQYRLNGEDFLSFNLSRREWEASVKSAVPIQSQWNSDRDITKDTRDYLEHKCVQQLSESRNFEAKECSLASPPTPAVFAKRSSDTTKVILTCLVSGFCCPDIKVEVFRDEHILTEEDGLFSSGILPNGDGTSQLRKSLDISNSTTASYSCEAHFQNQMQRVKWDGVIWNNAEPGLDYNRRHLLWILLPFAVCVVLILGGVYRCANRKRDRAPQYDADAETQLKSD